MTTTDLAILFLAVSVLFVGATLRERLASRGELSIAAAVRLRVALILGGVAVALVVLPRFL